MGGRTQVAYRNSKNVRSCGHKAFFKVFFAVRVDLSEGREEQTRAKCEKSWEQCGIDVDTGSHPPGDGVFINAGFPRRRF